MGYEGTLWTKNPTGPRKREFSQNSCVCGLKVPPFFCYLSFLVTVPVIERIFGQNLQHSDKYFAILLVIRLHSVPLFSVDRLKHNLVSSYGKRTAKDVRGNIGRHSCWMTVV